MSAFPLSPRLDGQTVLITGAAGGIGRATARLCAQRGARLILCDAAPEEMIRAANPDIPAPAVHRFDVSRRAEVERLADPLAAADAWADTAGICPRDDWLAPDWDAAFDAVIGVNLRGPINVARVVFPAMLARGYGRIALSGSLAGWTGGVRASPHYAAAKAGVHALVRWFAQRGTARNVCVNGVAPGPVATSMTAGQGYVALDGTKMRGNASHHKAMSYGRMKKWEAQLAA
jgi:NAD(P)-dependent dehydrogenase (short-subunit alcohol dehydrogenase family)